MKPSRQKQKFLSLCNQYDYDLLTGKKKMYYTDFERLTYLIMKFGYLEYAVEVYVNYPELNDILSKRLDDEAECFEEHIDREIENTDKWIDDFLSNLTPHQRSYYQKILKQNTEY
ncbi:TPA: hypothetical protein KQF10_002492 [Clostridioides difficile]|nr:hypothetical protein [Clostridioides difficile]